MIAVFLIILETSCVTVQCDGTFLNCRILKREEEVDGRQENISKALCSSLELGVPDVPNKGSFAPAMSVDGFLPGLTHISVL